jgi:hypothetical protein
MPVNAHRTARKLADLGVDVPDRLAALVATRDAVNRAATDNPVAALEADLTAGKITAKNAAKAVNDAATALVVREKARDVARDLEQTFDRLTRQALRDHGDQIIRSLRPTFDEAVVAVRAATDVLGPDPDERTVANLGPAAAQAWQQRRDALTTLAAIRRVRQDLADAGYLPAAVNGRVDAAGYLTDPADLDPAVDVWARRSEGVANLAAAGLALRLNTAAEHDAILNADEHARREREARRLAALAAQRADRKAQLEAERDQADEERRRMLERAGVTR